MVNVLPDTSYLTPIEYLLVMAVALIIILGVIAGLIFLVGFLL